ncbi:hypothetical protein HQ585_00635 [candidate division KSB1 bacterium]|nr:hypothetical protein [candidate division KSB1 bacterium]
MTKIAELKAQDNGFVDSIKELRFLTDYISLFCETLDCTEDFLDLRSLDSPGTVGTSVVVFEPSERLRDLLSAMRTFKSKLLVGHFIKHDFTPDYLSYNVIFTGRIANR